MYTVVFWFLNKQKINNTSQLAIIANDRLRAQWAAVAVAVAVADLKFGRQPQAGSTVSEKIWYGTFWNIWDSGSIIIIVWTPQKGAVFDDISWQTKRGQRKRRRNCAQRFVSVVGRGVELRPMRFIA